MTDPLRDALSAEEIAEVRNFHEAIGRCLDALTHAAKLLERALAELAAGDASPVVTRNVHIALLTSLGNHLRAMMREAPLAYPEPVATLAATAFELALTMAYIGGQEERASRWASHDEPTKSVWPIADVVKAVAAVEAGNATSEHATRLYRNYSQLCMAKHANPLLAGSLTFEGGSVVGIGPNPSAASVRLIQFALEQGVGLAHTALASLLGADLIASPVSGEIAELGSLFSALRKRSVERWGSEDPFPGKWRKLRGLPAESDESR